MQKSLANHYEFGEFFLAGQRVPAGIYRDIDRQRTIRLEEEDVLPASLDGRVACYERIDTTWNQPPPLWSNRAELQPAA